MPVEIGTKGAWQVIRPTLEWQTMPNQLPPEEFSVATDRYYVKVKWLH